MKKFLKSNVLVWIYFALAFVIELTAVIVTSGKFYIRSPYIFLLLQLLIAFVLLSIPSHKARHIVASALLIAFMAINLVFIVIFEMTETIFDYGMFALRNDGMAILESVPINFAFFTVCALSIALYIVFGSRFIRHAEPPVAIKWWAIPGAVVSVAIMGVVLYLNNRNFESDVTDKLYRSSEASYCEYGTVGNFLNELVKGVFFSNVKLGDEAQLENYIYDANNIYYSNFDNNSEYNVITILAESFEWHGFMQDLDLFVNGYNIKYQNYTDINGQAYLNAEQVLRELYPNLYSFYDNSLVMSNFYSREKTDISENISVLGAYPTNVYINYDFPNNAMSSSLPNVLKTLDEDITCNSFHNGSYTYYNRNKELISLGFDSYTATEQMKKMGMTDHSAKGERNLDAEMIEVCADKMFPTDKRFYTYITSITMHGQYTYRKNLDERGYYDAMAKFGFKPRKGDSFAAFNHNNFYYYAACVMELDRAIGVIMQELEERELKDNTIIAMFGDHNTYYSSLSNYVKDIDNEKDNNYTNLYRVPLMINVPDVLFNQVKTHISSTLVEELKNKYVLAGYNETDALNLATEQINERYVVGGGKQIIIKKFMCTADMVPTLMDLCGINVFGNLYFGHSAFELTESVLYSRAYDMFITDNMYFVSLNNIKYVRKDNTVQNNDVALKYADIKFYDKEDHISEVEIEAKILLDKLSACNRIFYNNYFARKNINDNTKTNNQIFKEKLIAIN